MTPDQPLEDRVEQVASSLALADGYNPNECDPAIWPERRERYRKLAQAAIGAIEGEGLTPEEAAEVLAFRGYIAAAEREDVARDLRRAQALSRRAGEGDG